MAQGDMFQVDGQHYNATSITIQPSGGTEWLATWMSTNYYNSSSYWYGWGAGSNSSYPSVAYASGSNRSFCHDGYSRNGHDNSGTMSLKNGDGFNFVWSGSGYGGYLVCGIVTKT